MSWFSDLAGKAESLLNNLDEQTGAVLRNHNGVKETKNDFILHPDGTWGQKKKTTPRSVKKNSSISETKSNGTAAYKSPPTRQARSTTKHYDNMRSGVENVRRQSPLRKTPYTNKNGPKTPSSKDYNDESINQFGLRHRSKYTLL